MEHVAELLTQICVFGSGHCFYTRSAAASSVYIYALALAYTVSVSIQRGRLGEHGHATHLLPVKRMRWFPTFLGFSYVTRMAWLVLSNMHAFEWVEGRSPNFVYTHMIIDAPILPTKIDLYVLGVTSLNKLATLLYFSAFTLLLRFWGDVLYQAQRAEKPLARFAANQSVIAQRYARDSKQQALSRKLFVVANVWIYLLEFALLVLKTLFPEETSVLFQTDYAVVAVFFLLLAIMLARCAYQLRCVLLKIEFSALAAGIARRVTWLGVVISAVFLARSVMLLISMPSIEVFDPHKSNPWLFYTIPEILPGVLVIYMMNVKRAPSRSKAETRKPLNESTPLLSDVESPPFMGQELHI